MNEDLEFQLINNTMRILAATPEDERQNPRILDLIASHPDMLKKHEELMSAEPKAIRIISFLSSLKSSAYVAEQVIGNDLSEADTKSLNYAIQTAKEVRLRCDVIEQECNRALSDLIDPNAT